MTTAPLRGLRVEQGCWSFNWGFCIPFGVLISWLNNENASEREGKTMERKPDTEGGYPSSTPGGGTEGDHPSSSKPPGSL